MFTVKYTADTPDKRALGLTAVPKLKGKQALLMKFSTPQMVSIWNRGFGYDIDIAFVGEDGVIFQIESLRADDGQSPTPLVFSRMPVERVLETRKGELATNMIGKILDNIINTDGKHRDKSMRLQDDSRRQSGEDDQREHQEGEDNYH